MAETLAIVAVILLIAWLMDRVWALRWHHHTSPNPAPPASGPEPEAHPEANSANERTPTQTLRKDWLRLGRRS